MNIYRYVVYFTAVGMLFLSVHFSGSTEGYVYEQHHFKDVNATILNFTTTQNDQGDDISFINLSIMGNYTSNFVHENKSRMNLSDGEVIKAICHPYDLYGVNAKDRVIVNITRCSNHIHSLNLTLYSWELRSIRDNGTIDDNNDEIISPDDDDSKDEIITPDDPEYDNLPSLDIYGILISILFSVSLIKRKVYDRKKQL